MNDLNREPENNLDWLGFCYVADELDPEQRAEFEQQLETDPLAQQAVVDAMQLSQSCFAALRPNVGTPPSSETVREKRATYLPAKLVFAASVALLVLVGGWAWYSNQFLNPPAMVAQDPDMMTSEELALAWAYATSYDSEDWSQENSLMSESMSDVDWDGELDESEANWMMVALNEIEDDTDSEGVPQ